MRLGYLVRQAALTLTTKASGDYWERRYRSGLTSGLGSYGPLAAFKAEIINGFVRGHGVRTVVEFGCGDGHQLGLAEYPSYLGLDVSKSAIDICHQRFRGDPTKSFLWYDPARTINLANFIKADLTLSLDVIYHLTEDHVYARYLEDLFSTSLKYVIVYSSDREGGRSVPHVRHRNFTRDVTRDQAGFRLIGSIENRYPEQSSSSFFLYERAQT
jgi:SAM-dependent methyltransferase